MTLVLVLLFGLGLVGAPLFAATVGIPLAGGSAALMTASGILAILLAGTLLVITRLYVKTKASEAFVRTGMGGMKVIQDGGALVIPVVHQIVRVSLETLRLDVGREGPDALITNDKLRADVRAEFYVRVQPDEESIRNAARSLGDRMGDANSVRALVEDKLVSALRTVAATKNLEELNIERDRFMEQVMQIVTPDLAHNGLTLETATISKLDQTDPRLLKSDNIFDAQGLRTIAQITQEQLTRRNELERAGEQARKLQDVETRKRVLTLEQAEAEAQASQAAQVATVIAASEREAREQQIAAERAIELAAVEKTKAIEVATRDQQQAIDVAERRRQEAIANAESDRARAEATLAQAEATREEARQAVRTVEIEAEAVRSKTQQVIAAQGEAERRYVEIQRHADADAYRVQKEAEARKLSADAESEAIRKQAEAEADAAKARASGDRAVAMVPVDVERERVSVERQRVEDVLQRELEAREAHGKAAQDFQLAQLRITKEAEIRIEAARATATLLGQVKASVFGTPEDVARMTDTFMRGMGVSAAVEGFLDGAGPHTTAAATSVAASLTGALGALVEHAQGASKGGNGKSTAAPAATTEQKLG
jgi:flotillin